MIALACIQNTARRQDGERGAYALGGGAVGGAGSVSGGEVAALAALNDLEGGAGLGGDGGGDGGGEALTLEQSLSDRLHTTQEVVKREEPGDSANHSSICVM